MTQLPGLRMGPLEIDRTADFGQVNASASARQLIRQHAKSYPPQLLAALRKERQDERSKALAMDEVKSAVEAHFADVGEELPKGSKIVGASVHGDEGDPEGQILAFVYQLPEPPDGSGRTGKGFIPYNADLLPESHEAGARRIRIAELKEAGLPWSPDGAGAAVEELTGGTSRGKAADARAQRAAQREADELRAENEDLKRRLAEVDAQALTAEQQRTLDDEAAGAPPTDSGVAGSPQNPEGGSVSVPGSQGSGPAGEGDYEVGDVEPWAGYDGDKAQDIAQQVRESGDAALAERVGTYEKANADRATVMRAVDGVLDRSSTATD